MINLPLTIVSLFVWISHVCALQPGFHGNFDTKLTPSRPSRSWRSRVLPFSGGGRGGEQEYLQLQQQQQQQQRSNRPTTWVSFFSAIPSEAFNATISESSFHKDRSTNLRREAEEFRRRAAELMTEVRSMEKELEQSRSSSRRKRERDTGELMDRLFLNRPLTPEAAAQVMKDEKWTEREAQLVLEGLFALASGTRTKAVDNLVESNVDVATRSRDTPGDAAEQGPPVQPFNSTEALHFQTKIDCLIAAAEILDEIAMSSKESMRRWSGRVGSGLRARRNDLQRTHERILTRQLVVYDKTAPANASALNAAEDQGKWEGTDNARWVPSSLLQFVLASSSRIEASDVKTIREKVLSGTAFFCTSTQTGVQAAVFRGNIRGVMTAERNITAGILADIQKRLEKEGLADRLQLFLLQDPDWRHVQSPPLKPAIVAISADVIPDERNLRKKKSMAIKVLKAVAAIIPILTTVFYSITCYALNPKFFDAVMKHRDIRMLSTCLPVFLGVVAVQAIHEIAHIVVARRRKIKIGWPFPLPSFQLGTFGCITPMRSFPENRSALLDFALSGPVSSMLVSIAMMITGIRLTVRATGADLLRFPVMPVGVLKSSLLTGGLLTLLAPKAMALPVSQPLPLHPIFMAGFAGLLSSALNLLPIFRLDGGRACSAAMGSRFGAVASSGTLLFLCSSALSSSTGVALSWIALILFFQREFDIPVRDEVTEVDEVRMGGWIGSLATAVLALVPFPGGPGFL